MDVSLVLEDFFVRVRISPVIKDLQKVKREVSYFPYVVRKKKKSRHELSKNRSMQDKNCEISGPYNFYTFRCFYYL